jgi:hypothetical protein
MNGRNVIDVLYDLLTNYAGIDSAYIDYTQGSPEGQWDEEKRIWFTGYTLNNIISEPESIHDIIKNICQSTNMEMWWDDVNQTVKIKANMPPTVQPSTYTMNDHIIEGSLKIKDIPKKRVSDIRVYYDKIDHIGDDQPANYNIVDVDIDTDAESADEYNEKAKKQIFARYFDATNGGQAAGTGGRILNRYRNIPREYEWEMDARDEELTVGDLCFVKSLCDQNPSGGYLGAQIQILEVKEVTPGHRYRYKGLTAEFTGRYGKIHGDSPTLQDYSSESQANQDAYAFIVPTTGLFPDNTGPYRII